MAIGTSRSIVAAALLLAIGIVVGLVIAAMIQSYQSPNALEGWQSLLGSLLGALVTLFAGYLAWAGIKTQVESESKILNAQTGLMTFQSAAVGRDTVIARQASVARRFTETEIAESAALGPDLEVYGRFDDREGPLKEHYDDLLGGLEGLKEVLLRHASEHFESGFLEKKREEAFSTLNTFIHFIRSNLSATGMFDDQRRLDTDFKNEYSAHSCLYRAHVEDLTTGLELEIEALKIRLAELDEFIVGQIHNPFLTTAKLSDRIAKYVNENSITEDIGQALREIRIKRDPNYIENVEKHRQRFAELDQEHREAKAAAIRGS